LIKEIVPNYINTIYCIGIDDSNRFESAINGYNINFLMALIQNFKPNQTYVFGLLSESSYGDLSFNSTVYKTSNSNFLNGEFDKNSLIFCCDNKMISFFELFICNAKKLTDIYFIASIPETKCLVKKYSKEKCGVYDYIFSSMFSLPLTINRLFYFKNPLDQSFIDIINTRPKHECNEMLEVFYK